MMTNMVDIYNYIYPIVSSSGFIKSNGYMIIQYDVLIMISEDNSVMSIVKINPVNILYIGNIHSFIACKSNDINNWLINTYFQGNALKYYSIIDIYNRYNNISLPIVYCEDDMTNIPGFDRVIKLNNPDWLTISNKIKLSVCKAITPVNKGDKVGVIIYDNNDSYIVQYNLYKKKLNNTIYTYMRILKI